MKKIAVVKCPYCDQPAALVDSDTIYQRSYGMIWMCKPCDAYTGIHQSSNKFAPLGTLANKPLRELRKQTHKIFDPIWKNNIMSRGQAYAWLAEQMGIEQSKCHVAMFRDDDCKKAIEIIKQYYEQNTRTACDRASLRPDMGEVAK